MSEFIPILLLGGPVFFIFALLQYGACWLKGAVWKLLPAAAGACILLFISIRRNPDPGCGLGDAILSVWVCAAILGMIVGGIIYLILRKYENK